MRRRKKQSRKRTRRLKHTASRRERILSPRSSSLLSRSLSRSLGVTPSSSPSLSTTPQYRSARRGSCSLGSDRSSGRAGDHTTFSNTMSAYDRKAASAPPVPDEARRITINANEVRELLRSIDLVGIVFPPGTTAASIRSTSEEAAAKLIKIALFRAHPDRAAANGLSEEEATRRSARLSQAKTIATRHPQLYSWAWEMQQNPDFQLPLPGRIVERDTRSSSTPAPKAAGMPSGATAPTAGSSNQPKTPPRRPAGSRAAVFRGNVEEKRAYFEAGVSKATIKSPMPPQSKAAAMAPPKARPRGSVAVAKSPVIDLTKAAPPTAKAAQPSAPALTKAAPPTAKAAQPSAPAPAAKAAQPSAPAPAAKAAQDSAPAPAKAAATPAAPGKAKSKATPGRADPGAGLAWWYEASESAQRKVWLRGAQFVRRHGFVPDVCAKHPGLRAGDNAPAERPDSPRSAKLFDIAVKICSEGITWLEEAMKEFQRERDAQQSRRSPRSPRSHSSSRPRPSPGGTDLPSECSCDWDSDHASRRESHFSDSSGHGGSGKSQPGEPGEPGIKLLANTEDALEATMLQGPLTEEESAEDGTRHRRPRDYVDLSSGRVDTFASLLFDVEENHESDLLEKMVNLPAGVRTGVQFWCRKSATVEAARRGFSCPLPELPTADECSKLQLSHALGWHRAWRAAAGYFQAAARVIMERANAGTWIGTDDEIVASDLITEAMDTGDEDAVMSPRDDIRTSGSEPEGEPASRVSGEEATGGEPWKKTRRGGQRLKRRKELAAHHIAVANAIEAGETPPIPPPPRQRQAKGRGKGKSKDKDKSKGKDAVPHLPRPKAGSGAAASSSQRQAGSGAAASSSQRQEPYQSQDDWWSWNDWGSWDRSWDRWQDDADQSWNQWQSDATTGAASSSQPPWHTNRP